MNFLSEILCCAEKMELESINKEVPKLQQVIGKLKKDIFDYTENIYIKFVGRPTENKLYLNKAQTIEQELQVLQQSADNLMEKFTDEVTTELKGHVTALNIVDFKLKTVLALCDFHEKIVKFYSLKESRQYLNCAKIICELENEIQEIPEDENFEIIQALRLKIIENKTHLLTDLSSIFKENIIEKQNESGGMILKISRDLHDLQEALLALYYQKSVVYCLHTFAKSLWQHYFIPIVDKTLRIETHSTEKYNILALSILDLKKSNYETVFDNLTVLLQFLKSNFNLILNDKLTTLKYIGEDIGDNVSELIIKHCLQDTIPSNAKDLENYKIVIEHTEKLEAVLRNCDIFKEDTASLLKYANNIDILFINKKCQVCNSTAEWIMKKDLYDMTEVGVPFNMEKPMDFSINDLPHCSVSKSAIELVEFIEKIMQQAVQASDVCAGRLFCTVQNIVTKYGLFVPQYHSKLLQTIPQQVALFHNNCLYISHELMNLNNTYSPQLSSKLELSCCVFKDEIYNLRAIAVDHFSNYIKGQIKQIQEIMSESGLDGPLVDNLEPKTEKCIRQCLRQQEILKTVWHKVLSYPIYNQTIGTIMDCLCNSIISSITKFEDIPSNIAEQLVEIIKLVLTRGPKLFSDGKEVALYVQSWYKLNELNFVLASSLLAINDRWADGKGPLALHFSGTELKSLIRALFQNTDRRAIVLAKILD